MKFASCEFIGYDNYDHCIKHYISYFDCRAATFLPQEISEKTCFVIVSVKLLEHRMDLNMVAVSWLKIMDVYAYFTARGLRGSSMHLESVYDVRN